MPRLFSALRYAGRSGRDSSDLLEAALELVGVAMVAVGPDGRLTHANRHARELLGAGCGALGTYPDTWMRELRPRTASGVPILIEDLAPIRALEGEVVSGVDVLVALPRGDVLLETAARPAKDRRGRRRGAVVTLVDVTELRSLEGRMRATEWAPWQPDPAA
ncbi:MAG TPA: PAS domain-containing protein [Solirubrobacteraceae bacterium]